MLVDITIRINIPDSLNLSGDFLRQAIFDEYTNYVTCRHMEDALEWMASKGKFERAGDTQMIEGAERIIAHHQFWAEIGKSADIIDIRHD